MVCRKCKLKGRAGSLDGDETDSSNGTVTLVRTASLSAKAAISGDWTGTPEYMSPEAMGQIKSVQVGQAADIFSFAIVLRVLLLQFREHVPHAIAVTDLLWCQKPEKPACSVELSLQARADLVWGRRHFELCAWELRAGW
eukprot:COSAG05_NODE_6531_length_942_cov_4.269276_1_plen_140_part_00